MVTPLSLVQNQPEDWARYEKKQPQVADFLVRLHPFFNDSPSLVPTSSSIVKA
jgi:hypothetical protein